MKHLLTITFLMICLASCKKNIIERDSSNAYLEHVKRALQDSVTSSYFGALDFSRTVQSPVNSGTTYLRIPFEGKGLNHEFVLLQTDAIGNIQRGRIISLEAKAVIPDQPTRYDGAITISSLSRDLMIQSPIVNGYIQAFHPLHISSSRLALIPSPYVTLPEVVVVGTRSSGGGISFGDFMYLQGLFGANSGNYDTYYVFMEGPDGPSGGGGGGGNSSGSSSGGDASVGSGPGQEYGVMIDFENQDSDEAIDIKKYLACFSKIPDVGATCTIEILADIPVDGAPSHFFNWNNGSPGHVFIKLNKKNGNQSVQQIIGWYPKEGYKLLLTTSPTPGKFVNNQHHEYNAAYTTNITPAQLQSTLTHILYLSNFIKYDIDEYNCTDFALDVFNQTVSPSEQLTIPKYDLPGGTNPFGSNTPNGLYQRLQSISQTSGNNASKVNMPGVKGWVGASDGACN